MSNETQKQPKKVRIVLTQRDTEILQYVAAFRIVTLEDLFRRFFDGLTVAAAKSTLRRLRGRQGGVRYLRPQKISAKGVGYVLTRQGCLTLGLPTKRCRSVGPKSATQKLALADYLRGSSNRTLIRGRLLREFLNIPNGRLPGATVVTEVTPTSERIQVVFVHHGGLPRGSAKRIASQFHDYIKRGWFHDAFSERTLDVVVLTGLAPVVVPLKRAMDMAIDEKLYTTAKKLHGVEQASTILGIRVQHVRSIEGLIVARFHSKKTGKGAKR